MDGVVQVRGAHPRRRGEHHGRRVQWGSPARLIPAGAGSTVTACAAMVRIPAHPRRRGEHIFSTFRGVRHSGSSPQARGAPITMTSAKSRGRLIPAGAGSTDPGHDALLTCGAHPRRRGEHGRAPCGNSQTNGSSPQARGARGRGHAVRLGPGLIPAGAGSTGVNFQLVGVSGAHPRRRGEHHTQPFTWLDGGGSSPQARGARPHRPRAGVLVGLIPAGAGSTSVTGCSTPCAGAHPRRRGEHARSSAPAPSSRGSSPQARGAHGRQAPQRGLPGLIPAGAGSTWSVRRRPPGRAAHPRRRGEHCTALGLPLDSDGSSPQARGAPSGTPRRAGR